MSEVIARQFLPGYIWFNIAFLVVFAGWLLVIGVLVQFGWECGLLVGGIRSAGFATMEEKLVPLVVNSLPETNLGMPYIFAIFIAYSGRFTEQLSRREQPLAFTERIQEWNGQQIRKEVMKMQESRLFKIVYYLLQNGKATAPELAQKFEVSIRTIYRDIDALSSAGIPIYATQGKGGGFSILNDYTLDKSLFSEQEQEQLLTALQGMTATTGKNSNELLTKLSGLFQIKSTNWIDVDFSDWAHRAPQQDTLNIIKEAIFQKRVKFLIRYMTGNVSKFCILAHMTMNHSLLSKWINLQKKRVCNAYQILIGKSI